MCLEAKALSGCLDVIKAKHASEPSIVLIEICFFVVVANNSW